MQEVPRQRCSSLPERSCRQVARKVCSDRKRKACVTLCEEVYWCKVCSAPRHAGHAPAGWKGRGGYRGGYW